MRRFFLTIACATAAGMVQVAQATPYGLSVNGTCDVGSCPADSAQAAGGGSSGLSNINVDIPNGDIVQLTGSRVGTETQTTGIVTYGSFAATFEGNSTGSPTAVSQADTLTVLENYLFNTLPTSVFGTSFTAYEQTTGSFSAGVASGSTLANSYTSNGTTVGTYGPFVAPSAFAGPLTLFNVTNIGTWTITDSVLVSFAAGSAIGSQIVFNASIGANPVPLPASVWLMLAGLGGLALSSRRRTA